jgi:D-threo-aldose 1-dehydrogenase
MASPVPIVPPVVLGRTGLRSTRLGLGTAGWPAHVSPEHAAAALRAAFDLGIRHLDCAAKYHTEEEVGRALRDVGAPAGLVVATKVCAYYDEDLETEFVSYNPAAARRSVERSLRLLGRERLEIVYIHDPAMENLPLIYQRGGVLDVLCALKDQGLITHLGMASWDHRSIQWAVEQGAFDVVQGFHVNTLLNRGGRRGVYAQARARGMGICDSGPYAGYILATGPVQGARYNYAPASPDVLDAARRLESACAVKGVSLADAALGFALQCQSVDVVVVASGDPGHIRSWARALDLPLRHADYEELERTAGPDHDVFSAKLPRIQIHL